MRYPDLFLVIVGIAICWYGFDAVINKQRKIGLRGMPTQFITGKTAQVAGAVDLVCGIVMILCAGLSWVGVSWLTQQLKISVWFIGFTVFIGEEFILAFTGNSFADSFAINASTSTFSWGIRLVTLVGILLGVPFLFVLYIVFEALDGNNTLRLVFLLIVSTGLLIMVGGVWIIRFYNFPLEKLKRKRKSKPAKDR